MASFMNQSLYNKGKGTAYPLKRLGGLEAGLDNSVEKK
jgi:hypothetical protein